MTTDAQKKAFKTYDSKRIRHEFRFLSESQYGILLKKAKEKGDINQKFKQFLIDNYG